MKIILKKACMRALEGVVFLATELYGSLAISHTVVGYSLTL